MFIGSGATLNQDATSAAFGAVSIPASNDPKAVGFSVSGGTLNLGIFTATGRLTGANYAPLSTTLKYTGLQGALGKAQLQGVDAVKLIGTGLVFQLNRTSVSNGAVLNWKQAPLSASNVALDVTDPTFRIGGSVGLSIADVVYARATVDVSRTLVSGVDDPDVAGTVARLQGDLLGISITGATLFIGTGATLNEDSTSDTFGQVGLPETNDPNAVGFSVNGGSLKLGIFTAREAAANGSTYTTLASVRKYTGLSGALGKAQLQGVDAVKLIGTGLVFQLNRSSVSGGAVLDWTQSAVGSAGVTLGSSDPTFRIGGSVGLSMADVVFGSATVAISRTHVSGVDDPDAADPVVQLKGDLLSISITQAKLFIGSGASLNEDLNSGDFGKVAEPAANDPKAVGFSVTGGSLDLGIFTAREILTSGTTYTTLPSVRKYTGLEGALGKAQLQGVDVVQMIGTSLVLQLNKTSVATGLVLDWTQGDTVTCPASLMLKYGSPHPSMR